MSRRVFFIVVFINFVSLFSFFFFSNYFFKESLVLQIKTSNLKDVISKARVLDILLRKDGNRIDLIQKELNSNGIYRLFLIENSGNILYERNSKTNSQNLFPLEFRKRVWETNLDNGMFRISLNREYTLLSFSKFSDAKHALVILVKEKEMFENITNIENKVIFLFIIITFISTLLFYLFFKKAKAN